MGICFSKKKKNVSAPAPSPTHEKNQTHTSKVVVQQQQQQLAQPEEVVEETHERKPVFLITPSKKKKQPTTQQPEVEAKVAPVADARKAELTVEDVRRDGGLMVVEEARIAPVRTSSCTKEEVESILIQCGRLSRSSSGKGVTEGGGNGGRRYSGSKRSYDFDNESKEDVEGELEKGPYSSRPSPRRRALSRERDDGVEHKRSDSRERGSGGGGRRVSRSPGRRSEGLVSNSNSSVDRSRQPGKMVSVPAREKGNNNNNNNPAVAEDGGVNRRRAPSPSPAVGGVRSSSPRSRSPANIRASNENSHPSQQPPQSLSRSSSKKAEHSPYRRNPMAEIDDNSHRAEQPPSRSNAHSSCNSNTTENQKVSRVDGTRKASSQSQSQKTKSEHRSGGGASEVVPKRSNSNSISRGVREQLRTCRVEQPLREPEVVQDVVQPKVPPPSKNNVEVPESSNVRTIARTRSSRRSSRDLDALVSFNPETHLDPTAYTFLLLEDINNYHQQTAGFSLPACVSKACSILDAVADLNSSSSDNNKLGSEAADCSSNNENFCSNGQMKDAFVESEVVVKDDLMEPSLHKYVSVRDKLRLEIEKMGVEMAPEESAGSNSFVGQPWPSTRELNSVDSSDYCCWTSSWSNTGDEVEASDQLSPPPLSDNHLLQHQQPQKKHQGLSEAANELTARGGRQQRSTSMSNSRKREPDHRQIRRGGAGVGGNGKTGGAIRANVISVATAGSS